MPVRKVRNHGGNAIGTFPSMKMARSIQFESGIEEDFLYLADHDARITFIEEQPLTIEYAGTGRRKVLHYTPDFHVRQEGRDLLIECKPALHAGSPRYAEKFAAAEAYCAALNWEFRVVTDTHIRAGFRLRNVRRLTYYARYTVAASDAQRIARLLLEAGTRLPLGSLLDALAPTTRGVARASVFHLAFHHRFDLDLVAGPITDRTPVSLPAAENR